MATYRIALTREVVFLADVETSEGEDYDTAVAEAFRRAPKSNYSVPYAGSLSGTSPWQIASVVDVESEEPIDRRSARREDGSTTAPVGGTFELCIQGHRRTLPYDATDAMVKEAVEDMHAANSRDASTESDGVR